MDYGMSSVVAGGCDVNDSVWDISTSHIQRMHYVETVDQCLTPTRRRDGGQWPRRNPQAQRIGTAVRTVLIGRAGDMGPGPLINLDPVTGMSPAPCHDFLTAFCGHRMMASVRSGTAIQAARFQPPDDPNGTVAWATSGPSRRQLLRARRSDGASSPRAVARDGSETTPRRSRQRCPRASAAVGRWPGEQTMPCLGRNRAATGPQPGRRRAAPALATAHPSTPSPQHPIEQRPGLLSLCRSHW